MTKMSGITRIELVTVLTIVGIMTAIGVPSFQYITSSNRISTEVNGLLGDMRFARSESIKEGVPVTICSSSNGTSCAGTTSWNSGWIVFADANGNHVVDTGESVLRWQKAFTSTDTFTADNSVTYALFNREGFASTGATTIVTITLHATPANTQTTRCLEISVIGIPVTEKSGTDNCT